MEKVMDTIPDGPTRVIVDADGLGVPMESALHQYQVFPEIIFLRNDGWTLGAPSEYECVAYNLWENEWTHFAHHGDLEWTEIAEYK